MKLEQEVGIKPYSVSVSLDDISILKRIKSHLANCDCCKKALQKQEVDGFKANQPETTRDVTTSQPGDRSYNGN